MVIKLLTIVYGIIGAGFVFMYVRKYVNNKKKAKE